MKLRDVIRDLELFDEESTIYAVAPFTSDSDAIVELERDASLPRKAQSLKLSYFLEVFDTRMLLEGWIAHLDAEPNLETKCARLIAYVRDDA